MRRIAFLANARVRTSTVESVASAAATAGMQLERIEVQVRDEVAPTVTRIAQSRKHDVLFVQQDAMLSYGSGALLVAKSALAERLPCVGLPAVCEAGGLLGYGPDPLPLYRLAAGYVDRILRGANAGQLPMQRATYFRTVANQQTAAALGIRLPHSVLVRMDAVIGG